MKKKYLIGALLTLVLIGTTYGVWSFNFSPTKIALINYPEFMATKIARSCDNYFIDVEPIEVEEIADLEKYDMLLIFGMGLKITAEQEAYIKSVGEKNTSIYLASSTNKSLQLSNLNDSIHAVVKDYLGNGGNKNYANALRYIRTTIHGRTAFVETPDAPFEIPSDVLFHVDEEIAYEDVQAFEKYCIEKGFHQEGRKKVLFFTSIPGPFNANRDHLNSLINELQSREYNIYPVSGFRGRFNYMKEITPDLIVYIPHGRLSMGGSAKLINQWLEKQNIPVLCPITVHQRYSDWIKDKNGMMGGLLSQSVTMPEFDGGIVPYAVFAQYEDERGFLTFKAVPSRLKKFGQIVENYLGLKDKNNADKKVAFVYFKGPGKSALTAANMEVLPSLHQVLLRMKKEGYDLGDLPNRYVDFQRIVMQKGPVLGTYADGAFDEYLKSGDPELIAVSDYQQWCRASLPAELINDVEERYGKAPGEYMSVSENDTDYIAVARVQFGNVVLLPQQMPGLGDNQFQLVHGAKVAPPHAYIAPYLWVQKGFKADAIFHFGTHGSLEFTPGKQIALSDYDWTDPLIGTTPHNYVYTISNVGEGMIAKRRSYAALQTYLTPPFMAAKALQSKQLLQQKINLYVSAKGALKREYALSVKEILVKEGMHAELGLDEQLDHPYTEQEMERVTNYLEELAHEKVTGGLYTMGVPYTPAKIDESILMMFNEELAYHLAEVDIQNGKVTRDQINKRTFFRNNYIGKSERIVKEVIQNANPTRVISRVLDPDLYQKAKDWKIAKDKALKEARARRMAARKANHGGKGKKSSGGHPHGAKVKANKHSSDSEAANEEMKKDALYTAVLSVEHTLLAIGTKKAELYASPEAEMKSILNALNGGYTAPSPGGDPISNPESIATGRNLFAVNAEQTPSKEAWKVGQKLGDDLLADYKGKHGAFPEKVSFTLWAGSFIESEGTTIAQILYMLGVEPVWTPRGKVNDIRLMTEEELGRPRIDVVVQTSGQLRDLAASRLLIINRAIAMAADAEVSTEQNFVDKGIKDAEKLLVELGFSPKEARINARQRVFGGVNGNYGTAIMGLVENSDRWDSTKTVAQTYINNMGAVYGDDEEWGEFNKGVFKAALLNTQAVVQPRQSNTWGALSLDHVYEFMGGLNLAVKEVTGNDAESYFNDFRNTSNPRIQGLKEAIGVESRTTLLNERYIKEYMKGGASSAASFAEIFRNTFGWNVMKPSVIEERLWNDLYDVYVEDKLQLKVHEFFEKENPYALQEMTAVMLETVRKGMWKATPEQVQKMTQLHAELIEKHEAGCSGFVCDNAKLRAYINEQLPSEMQEIYAQEIKKVRESEKEVSEDNVVLKKDEKIDPQQQGEIAMQFNSKMVGASVLVLVVLIILFIRRRRSKSSIE